MRLTPRTRFAPSVSTYLRALVLVCAGVLLGTSAHAATKCLDDAGDAAQITATRAAVDAACGCFEFAKSSEYKKCAAGIVKAQADASLLRKECTGTVKKIYANSVCGRKIGSKGPAVPCVADNSFNGKVTCAIKPAFGCTNSGSNQRDRCFGTTTCLDAADTNGDLRIGAPGDSGDCTPAPSSFTDNGDGTITDASTGLMWEKLSDDESIHDRNYGYTWADAAAVKVAALNGAGGFAGHTDWRVPTMLELLTLVRTNLSPSIDAAFNTGCAPGCTVLTCSCTGPVYWSSDVPTDPGNAWSVYYDGNVVYPPQDKDFILFVRAVRGGS